MQADGSVFDQKRVFDANHVPLGTVRDARRDPKTRDTTQIVLELFPDARARIGAPTVTLPAKLVTGMRRDSVTVNTTITELARDGLPPSMMKK